MSETRRLEVQKVRACATEFFSHQAGDDQTGTCTLSMLGYSRAFPAPIFEELTNTRWFKYDRD